MGARGARDGGVDDAGPAHGASEEHLDLALEAGGLGVWEWERTTGATQWDAALEALFGLPAGGFKGTIDAWVELVHPDDRAEVLATVATATERGRGYSIEHRIVWPDGAVRWLHCLARPVLVEGCVTGYIGVTGDVTDRHLAEAQRAVLLAEESAARAAAEAAAERLRFLAEATAALGETLDPEERLARLAASGVPRIADCAAVHLRKGDEVRLVEVFHIDPEQQSRMRDVAERWPARLDAPTGVGAVIRDGTPHTIPELIDEQLQALARDDEHLSELRRLDVSSGVVLPIRGRGEPVGAVTFLTTGSRRLEEADTSLAADLVSSAGVLIENGVLLEARARAQEEQRYQAALLGALFEASVDGILVVDPDGRVLSRNDRFAQVWGFAPEAARTQDDEVLLGRAMDKVAEPSAFIERVRALYRNPTTAAHEEIELADGRILDRYGVPLHTDDGAYLGWAWTFRDVTTERAQQVAIAAAGQRSAALARTLQESLLPPRLPTPDGIDLAARYHPALQGIEVGGDFYDVFAVDDGWCLVLGDVCGKGPDAARATGLARWAVRAAAIRSKDPAAILTELNTVMRSDAPTSDDIDPRFATVCCMRARARPGGGLRIEIASAGHPAPFLLRAGGRVSVLPLVGTPVGLFEEVDVTTVAVELGLGEGIIVVTDGVLEARDEHGEELQEAGVAEVVRTAEDRSAAALSQAIERRALAQQGGVARDDIAILVAIAL